MTDPPVLQGRIVRLRLPHPGDVPELVRIRRTPEVLARWCGGDDLAAAVAADVAGGAAGGATGGVTGGVAGRVVELDGRVIGWIQWEEEDDPDYRHAGIDVYLDPAVHGRGLGADAVRTVARHLMDERGHHRLVIDPAADNVAAIRCYEKVGFRPVGVMRRYERGQDGTWHDGLLMDLLAGELR